MKKQNVVKVHDNYSELISKNGESILVDNADLATAMRYTWCVSKTGYAVANIKGKVTRLHRYLLAPKKEELVDHVNGNPLDNRRSNLRICGATENSRNVKVSKASKSGVLGIRITPSGKYLPRITVNYQELKGIKRFDTLEEAIAERNRLELLYHGQFSSHLSREVTQ
jgi:hypothetical protein